MLSSQSKTVSLLQLSFPQVPLFRDPQGDPPPADEQLEQLIFCCGF